MKTLIRRALTKWQGWKARHYLSRDPLYHNALKAEKIARKNHMKTRPHMKAKSAALHNQLKRELQL